jgi:cysteine desulfurase
MKTIYLDHASTCPIHPDVITKMMPYIIEHYGNPSSLHTLGKHAKEGIKETRRGLAAFIGAEKEEIVFTSGGTEANNLAIKGVAYANRKKGNHIITSAIEHKAILETCKFLEDEGWSVTYLPVNRFGTIDPKDVISAITDKTVLISIMHANNEIGTIEPIKEISDIAHERGVYMHTDAVQSFGHIPTKVDDIGVDLMSLSGHKIYGPKGVGALYVRGGTRIVPILHGGEQENGKRAGTENIVGIVGLGAAVELAAKEMEQESKRLSELRDNLINRLLTIAPDIILNGDRVNRLPNNISICIGGIEGETIMMKLNQNHLITSVGSACSSGKRGTSHVLNAIGVPETFAYGALRVTLGRDTTEEDLDCLVEILRPTIIDIRYVGYRWQ